MPLAPDIYAFSPILRDPGAGRLVVTGSREPMGVGQRRLARRNAKEGGTPAMYGTLYRCTAKPGQGHVAVEIAQRWTRERAPQIDGFVASYLLRPERRPDELLGLVIFESEASYRKNAEDPEQHRWHDQFRAGLEADIEWNDGEIAAMASVTVPL
ncbi:MAG: antibiotic biosynthesis monooxygenase family protein [Thermomicrobiales bacterium]